MSGFEKRFHPTERLQFPKIAVAMHVHLERRGMTPEDIDDYLCYLHNKEHRWLAWEIDWLEQFTNEIDQEEVGRHLDPVLEEEGITVTSANDEMRWCLACLFYSAIRSVDISLEEAVDILSPEERARLAITHTAIMPRPNATGQTLGTIDTATTKGDSQ